MPKLQYTGASHFRTISAADFRAAGVEGAEKLEVCREDVEHDGLRNPGFKVKNTTEVSQEVADFLTKAEKSDWKVVDEPTQAAEPNSGPSGGLEASQENPPTGSEGAGADATASAGATRTTGRTRR